MGFVENMDTAFKNGTSNNAVGTRQRLPLVVFVYIEGVTVCGGES